MGKGKATGSKAYPSMPGSYGVLQLEWAHRPTGSVGRSFQWETASCSLLQLPQASCSFLRPSPRG
eukprot:8339480-Alexandrium_andersonii.AAC.1